MFGVLYYTKQCGTISLQLVRAAKRASHVWCFIMHKSMWDDFATSFSCVARLVAAVWKTTRSKIKKAKGHQAAKCFQSQLRPSGDSMLAYELANSGTCFLAFIGGARLNKLLEWLACIHSNNIKFMRVGFDMFGTSSSLFPIKSDDNAS
jgi:hypothetical protein